MNQVIQEHHELFAAIEQGNETLAAQRLGHHLGKLDDELPKLRGAYPEYFQD